MMIVVDNDGDCNGEASMPNIIRKKMVPKSTYCAWQLPQHISSAYCVPLLSALLNSFKCFLGHEPGVSSGSGHLDVERAGDQ